MARAQISTEFIILVMVVMIMFIIFYKGSFSLLVDFDERQEEIAVRDMTLRMREEILLAQKGLDGYERQFSLDQNLSGRYQYSVLLRTADNLLIINTSETSFDLPIPPLTVIGDGKTFTIRKENGAITVTRG